MTMGVMRISTIFDKSPTAETAAGFDPSVTVEISTVDQRVTGARVDVDCPTHNNSSSVTSAEMSDDKALAILRARCPGTTIRSVSVEQIG